ncbi:MAG: ABC transporter [Cyanobacteria bacterium DS2.3.42]|nr:ABC transporter [Cyanobacteria bacterium DS2.3.42]
MQNVVEIRELEHCFGQGHLKTKVLTNINFQLRKNEIVILTGPSGSGKTTLLTLIGGLRSVQSGNLSVLGCELRGADYQSLLTVRRKVGYIFQAHNLLRFLTAKQNVRMSLELHGLNSDQVESKAADILERVGLMDHLDKYPDQLSGGQKQRVAVARALAAQPQLVLADEPTAALDKKSGREVVTIMQHLTRERGCSIMMVTHDARVLDVADRIIYMEDGCIVDNTSSNPQVVDQAPGVRA